jgi:hypothetical protein
MRYSPLAGLALLAALALPLSVGAQTPRVKITDPVRLGFPGSIHRAANNQAPQTRFKAGAWAPLYVDLDVRDAALKAGTYVLQVETTDSDDMQNVYVEKRFLPTVEVGEQPTLLTYVRLGSSNSEIMVRLLDAHNSDREYAHKQLKFGDNFTIPMDSKGFCYLSMGGKVRGLYKALVSKQNPQGGIGRAPGVHAPDEDQEEPDPEENGYRYFANLDTVNQMPTYWFGYQAVDCAILLTGAQKFVDELNAAQKDDPVTARREALAEWVRRGGRLIVSVSKNHQEVNQILQEMKIIDLTIEGRTQVPRLQGVDKWANAGAFPFVAAKPKNQPNAPPPVIEIAKLKPGRGVQVLAGVNSAGPYTPGDQPVMVRAPCGLGSVIVCAFDLDEAPFTTWKGQPRFWEKIKLITEPSDVGEGPLQNLPQWRNPSDTNSELGAKLVHTLENFPDVPVISFGWVALFILVYILIVGPLDYFFLKKVVKRLELTWITFPAVVIAISAVAYFAAYYLKGKDLRINKVDVVDVDLHGNNVYGNTWFILFSPRIQNYTIGVEPGTGWGTEEKDPKKFGPVVGWLGRPDEGWGGGRGGSQGLFRRAYNYAPDLGKSYGEQPAASGLIGVPIQVWSTKTFSASWARPIKDDELIEARLEVAKNDQSGMKLSGTLTSHLPVELRNAVLFYRDRYYALDNLTPGDPQRIDAKMAQSKDPQQWFSERLALPTIPSSRRPGASYGQDVPAPVGTYVKSVLFHAYPNDTSQGNARNSSLRYLDEKWRLDKDNTKEAILFGVAVPPGDQPSEGDAETMSQSGLSASKLWLGQLPGVGTRSPIQGTLTQETYVRVYIPVATK